MRKRQATAPHAKQTTPKKPRAPKRNPLEPYPAAEAGAEESAQKTDENVLSYLQLAGVDVKRNGEIRRLVCTLPYGAYCYFQYPKNLPLADLLPCLRPALRDVIKRVETEYKHVDVKYGIRTPENNENLPFRRRWQRGWISVQVCQPCQIAAPSYPKRVINSLKPITPTAAQLLDATIQFFCKTTSEVPERLPLEKPQIRDEESSLRQKIWEMRQPALRARLKAFQLSTRGKVEELKERLLAAIETERENPQPAKPKRKRLFQKRDFAALEAEEAGTEEEINSEEEEEF